MFFCAPVRANTIGQVIVSEDWCLYYDTEGKYICCAGECFNCERLFCLKQTQAMFATAEIMASLDLNTFLCEELIRINSTWLTCLIWEWVCKVLPLSQYICESCLRISFTTKPWTWYGYCIPLTFKLLNPFTPLLGKNLHSTWKRGTSPSLHIKSQALQELPNKGKENSMQCRTLHAPATQTEIE